MKTMQPRVWLVFLVVLASLFCRACAAQTPKAQERPRPDKTVERKRSTLEFRIVPNGLHTKRMPLLSEVDAGKLKVLLAKEGPLWGRKRGDVFQWFEIGRAGKGTRFDMTGEWRGKKFVLLCGTQPDRVMIRNRGGKDAWGLKRVALTQDEFGRPAVHFRFDEKGRKRFARLTQANVNNRLALLVDGKVVAAPSIREPLRGGMGIVTGDFTRAEVRSLVDALKRGMVPVVARRGEVALTPLRLTPQQRAKVKAWLERQGDVVQPAAFARFLRTILDAKQREILEKLVESPDGRLSRPDAGPPWGKPVNGLQCRLLPATQTVEVAEGAKPKDVEVFVTYELRNVGEKPVKFSPFRTPLEGVRDHIFDVIGPDGKEASYLGKSTKRERPSRSGFLPLDPGKKLARRVKLLYQFNKRGPYQVSITTTRKPAPNGRDIKAYYDGDVRKTVENPDNVWTGMLKSNTVTVQVVP